MANRKTSSPDDHISPEKRRSHECALVDNHVYLFGGANESNRIPRHEIWMLNVRTATEKKWVRRLARGRTIPPPCAGVRCVVIDKMIYSYGGDTDEGFLGIVYRLDPGKMKWIEVSTPIGRKKPHERSLCCLCAIGLKMVMFGGFSEKDIPHDQLQSGATQDGKGWNNDIYEFEFEKGHEKGMWLDLELSGTRPSPLLRAAMATIDQHRALLLGRNVTQEIQFFLMNLKDKTWTVTHFNVKPSPRLGHTICHLAKQGLEDNSICLLICGLLADKTKSNYVYILDCDDSKAYQMDVDPRLGKIWQHTCNCVQNEDKSTDVIVTGGNNLDGILRPIVNSFSLGFLNEPYMRIEREILLSRISASAAMPSPRLSLPSVSQETEIVQRELKHLRRRCAELSKEKESIREEFASAQHLVERKDGNIAEMRRELASVRLESEAALRRLRQEIIEDNALMGPW